MGFERNIKLVATALALLPSPGALSAEPREPLVVTQLPDPALVPLSGTEQPDLLAEATRRFRAAIAQAMEADQRSVDEACKSRSTGRAAVAARYDWQASCLYHRH
jgi:hypothetical protein